VFVNVRGEIDIFTLIGVFKNEASLDVMVDLKGITSLATTKVSKEINVYNILWWIVTYRLRELHY